MKVDLLKKPIASSLLYFVIAALLGLAMRSAFILDMPEWFHYKNIQHAHSHVALSGWLFAIFYISVIYSFGLKFRRYRKLFWALQFAVLGMLVSFPLVGYHFLSTLFTTIHILLIYVFVYKVWRDLNNSYQCPIAKLFLKASLFFLALSTLGTWSLGPIMAMGMKGSALYYGAIQFYLHFLFNGWFIFALLSILFSLFYLKGEKLSSKKAKRLFWVLVVATTLTFALAVSWSTPHIALFIINSIGVLVQLYALILLLRLIRSQFFTLNTLFGKYTSRVIGFAIIALILKTFAQSLVAIPVLAEVSYTVRNFVIGFIHLLMLGCLTLFSFGIIALHLKRALHAMGTWLFVIGVIMSEILLFMQGFMFWQGWGFMPMYYILIVVASALLFIGITMIFVDVIKVERISTPVEK